MTGGAGGEPDPRRPAHGVPRGIGGRRLGVRCAGPSL